MKLSCHSIETPIYTAECVEIASEIRDSYYWGRLRIGIITDYPPSCTFPPINFTASAYRGSFCFFRLAIAWHQCRTPRFLIRLCDHLENLVCDSEG